MSPQAEGSGTSWGWSGSQPKAWQESCFLQSQGHAKHEGHEEVAKKTEEVVFRDF